MLMVELAGPGLENGSSFSLRFSALMKVAQSVLPASSADSAELSFVRLGGDSLRAMRLAAEAAASGVSLQVRDLLSDRPLAEVLASALASATEPGAAADHAVGFVVSAECSPAQQGMWIREMAIGPMPYNLVFLCFIDGDLDRNALAAALGETIQRHEGLRTVFVNASGQIERRVLERVPLPLEWRSHAGDESCFEEHIRAVGSAEGQRPFDLPSSPAFRFIAISHCCGPRHALVLCAHHIVLDGWAVGLVLREIFSRYDHGVQGLHQKPEPPPRFEDYLQRQRGLRTSGHLDRQSAFWQRQLAGIPTRLDLPADRSRPAFPDPRGARHPIDFGPTVTVAVAGLARCSGITSAGFILAAFGLTLSRYTQARTLVIGMPVAGRPAPELAELVAVTVNVVPVRIDVDDDLSVRNYIARVQDSLAQSLDHADLPFQELVAQLGLGGRSDRHPLVQAAFGIHNDLIPWRLHCGDANVRVEEGHGGGAQFDLQLFIRSSQPSLAGDLEYASGVWTAAEAAAFGADLRAAASELARSPSLPLESIRCIAADRRALLDRVNDTRCPYPLTSVDEAFRNQAQRSPQAVAVREGARTLSYEQLAAAASVQARLLTEAGVTPGSTVLVPLERSIAQVVAVLGVLWAGAAYVGIDHDTPAARVDQLAAILLPAAVVGGGQPSLPDLPRVPAWDNGWAGLGGGDVVLAPDPERLACVTFTSGSTGYPKGVCIPHRGILRLAAGLDAYAPIGPGDRMLRFSSLSFDASALEIWMPLVSGAAIEIHPAGLPSPTDLGRFVQERGVTVAWLTSGLFGLVSEFAPDYLGALRRILTGGDVVPAGHVRDLLRRHPGLVIVNGYGPSENTVFTTVHAVSDPAAVDDPLPIGTPVANTQVYILDERQRLVPPGARGELYTAGDGLASGYFADLSETARSFGEFCADVPARMYRTGDLVRLDTGGRLRFIGRKDDQAKIRGFRVEPAEIASVLRGHDRVADALVLVVGVGSEDKQLLGCCIPADDGLAVEDVAGYLRERLPGYMVPALWVFSAEFPLTGNGKVDRAALRQMARPTVDSGGR
jgi:amino acid adenylation domain-containing protein